MDNDINPAVKKAREERIKRVRGLVEWLSDEVGKGKFTREKTQVARLYLEALQQLRLEEEGLVAPDKKVELEKKTNKGNGKGEEMVKRDVIFYIPDNRRYEGKVGDEEREKQEA